mmetsp:Transcript_23455/g.65106  ORF Transcript_23455/g.65106 Transcript_23455/m.65106 type:complete len:114 (+) Transcript_23455:459-800(+)
MIRLLDIFAIIAFFYSIFCANKNSFNYTNNNEIEKGMPLTAVTTTVTTATSTTTKGVRKKKLKISPPKIGFNYTTKPSMPIKISLHFRRNTLSCSPKKKKWKTKMKMKAILMT